MYAFIAAHHPMFSQIERWVPKLEQFDPENALPYFIVAEAIDINQVLQKKIPKRTSDESLAWKNAMSSAFQSSRLDDYLDRVKALDRRVILHYRFDDLYQVLPYPYRGYLLPMYSAWDSSRYAELVLQSGETLETRGDTVGARDKYLAVARFSQMMNSAGLYLPYAEVTNVPRETYKRLQGLSEKEGLQEQARFYASLAALTKRGAEEHLIAIKNRFGESDVPRWSANLVKASGLAMFLCAGILLTCLVYVIRRRFRGPKPPGVGRITTAFGIGGAAGLLLSSATLYVTYRPYAESFRSYLDTGDESQLPLLSSFLSHTWVLLGSEGFDGDVRVYFWFGVSMLCVLALLLAVIPFVAKHLRPPATST